MSASLMLARGSLNPARFLDAWLDALALVNVSYS